jgi:ATP-dependent DNA helicase RecG
MTLDAPVAKVKGIGEKKAKLFEKLGIRSIADLIYFIPRGYESAGQSVSISDLKDGEVFNITAVIRGEPSLRRIKSGLNLVKFSLHDESGWVEAVFFNQPYIRNMYKAGDSVYVSGRVKRIGKGFQFTNPHMEKQGGEHSGINPVYSLTAGLTQKTMRLAMKAALDVTAGQLTDIFTNEFRTEHKLSELNYSIVNIHFPDNEETLALAKRRLIFEELLLFNIALSERESGVMSGAKPMSIRDDEKELFLNRLGYEPTHAQKRVMNEIENDLKKQQPMNRLLQGDVGSGKTTPAFYAMHICIKSGCQCVLMAPTEVLATQHYANAQQIFCDVDIKMELLTGSTPAAQRRMVYENIANGQTDIVIGTHAVLYDNVQFANLGLVITDEQHRFGVGQRAMLETKARSPHTLIMSATPIPRTLALILYGKTDISILDELPPGRRPVKTFCVLETKRRDMYGFIQGEIDKGAQVFVVCPLVEDSDVINVRSSEQVFKEIQEQFSDVALLHGRLKPQEKNDIMARFKAKEFSILVSTTVIEVGVDVPEATIMVIENAERFGLAQLHQLRGRVGRGRKPSYCFLMSEQAENERLSIMCKTNDGFKIAEEDLRLRGPGQFLGAKQSGMSDLYMANLIKDMALLTQTRELAKRIKLENYDLFAQWLKAANARFSRKFEKTVIN